jgi:glycosyltransferase involved in cell wall biosynthesis
LDFVASEAVQTLSSPVEERSAARRRLAIVPALNEEASVARVVAEIRAADPGFEVVVVDDGSLDRTAEVAEAAGARVLKLPYNLGIGGAVQTGYRYAYENGYSIAVQVDGDGQHDPQELERLLAPLVAGEADVVIGSRFAGAGTYRPPLSRRPGIQLFAWIVSLVVRRRITDSSSSFRALNRRALALYSADYPHGFLETVEATVLGARSGLRLAEVPVVMRERAEGTSTLTFARSLWYAAKVLLAVFVSLFRRPVVHHLEEEP